MYKIGECNKAVTANIYNAGIDNFKRAGIIPYFIDKKEVYFFLGVDERTTKLIDFGGSIDANDLNFIEGAIRELNEESANKFNIDAKDIMEDSISIYNDDNIIILVNISMVNGNQKIDPVVFCEQYREKYLSMKEKNVEKHLVENSYIMYISEKNLIHLCKNEKIEVPYKSDFKEYPKIYNLTAELLKFGSKGYSSIIALTRE